MSSDGYIPHKYRAIEHSFDKYDRLLANVYTIDYFVNGELLWGGFATVYPDRTTGKFNIWNSLEWNNIFYRQEKDAKENKRGLWGKCNN